MDARLARLSLRAFSQDRLTSLLGCAAEEWRRSAKRADADAIHDFRVSLRRFGEALRLLKPVFPKQAWRQVRSELRQVMRFAGQTRDVDIARETFAYADIALPSELAHFLNNERAIAETSFRAALAVGVETRFDERWSETLGLRDVPKTGWHPPLESIDREHQHWQPEQSAAANAQTMLPGLLAGYCAHGSKLAIEGVKAARLHELRLNGKHLRYALELFRPIYGRKMDELLSSFKQTQSDLGEVSDCTATIRWLKEKEIHRGAEGQQLRTYLTLRADKGARRFAEFWRDHWGLFVFRDRWIGYLTRYAGRVPPNPRARLLASAEVQPAMATILSQADEIAGSGVSEPYSGVINPV